LLIPLYSWACFGSPFILPYSLNASFPEMREGLYAIKWPAGPTLGPRYLAPILPLLALPCALGVQRFPRFGMALAGYSILITTVATLTNASPPLPGHPNPLFDLHIPMLLKGQLAPNLGTVCGLPPWLSVVLYYAILCGGIWWLWRRLPPESPAAVGALDRAAEKPVSHAS
jgi:hypothetical protein